MKRWTKDEEELLVELVNDNWLYKDIANELNRTRNSIEHKCKRLNISNNFKVKLKTTKQYKEDLKIKCPTMICLGEYTGKNNHILHKCLICGKEYNNTPISKLQGNGCKYCAYSECGANIPLDKKGLTYLVYIPKYDLYKIGITSRSIQERMKDNRISNYEIILEHTFKLGIDAINLESKWKHNLKKYLVNTGKLISGNTETFRI